MDEGEEFTDLLNVALLLSSAAVSTAAGLVKSISQDLQQTMLVTILQGKFTEIKKLECSQIPTL